jgi:hypothetical protein
MARKTAQLGLEPPPLEGVLAFRGVHVIGTVRYTEEGRSQLVAAYYASCLIGGPNPVWGVWHAASGKFWRFYAFKQDIRDAMPKFVWRRKMAEWDLKAISDLPVAKRRAMLRDRYNAEVPNQK